MMNACPVIRSRRFTLALVLVAALAACSSKNGNGDGPGGLGGGGGTYVAFDGEKSPYGPKTETTRLQSTIAISSTLLPALNAAQNTAVVGQKTLAGVSYDRLATSRSDNPSEGGEYWIKPNSDGTIDFAGFQHSDLLAGFLGSAATTFTTPIKVNLNAPVGVSQSVTATGTVTLGDSASPSKANFTGQYTLTEKDATVATGMGPVSGCSHFTGSASSDSAEVPVLLKGLTVTADLYYHPSYGVVAFSTPTLGVGTVMTGTEDCGSMDASDYRIIRKMGVVDATASFNLDSYACDGNAFAADKNTHAIMLLEVRWLDEATAMTTSQPLPIVEFGTPMGYFPNSMTMTPASVFHPEENVKGFKYWYSYVSQAAKNEAATSTAYHIKVRGGAGQAPVRVTARIYYKTIPSLVRPEPDTGVGVSNRDAGADAPVSSIRDGSVTPEVAKADAGSVIPGVDSGLKADAGIDAPVVTSDGGGIVTPGTPTIVEEFDTLPTATTQFVPIQAAGGDFAKFATVSGGRLVVDVPAGNNWGKTGVRSKDPVFEVTADMATNPWSVQVELDPVATNGFVVVLSPTAYDDIWNSENFWMNWIRHPTAGGTSSTITNTQNTADTTTTLTNTPLTAPGTVAVVSRPGQIQGCTSSGWGMEGTYAWMKTGVKVYAYVFAHPYDAGMPVKMAVKSIKVGRGASCGAAGSIPAYTALPEKAVFADDLSAGVAKNWTPIQAAGGDFAKFATTPAGDLMVDVPAGNNWGKTGVRSSYFMFDVRDDMLITPLSLTFDFVPTKTSGFVVVLSPTAYDDIWTSENFWAAFVRHPTGAGASANITNTQNTMDTTVSLPNLPSEAPSSVTVSVRPGHAQMCTSTGWGMEGDYAWMKTGTKVYAYAFAHAYDAGMPVQMDLTNVRAERTAACGASGAIPAYPAPAPRVLFQDSFAGGYAQNWVGIQAAGGDFAKFAAITTNEVYVNVPADNNWGKTGIRSNYYLFDVRSDFATSPVTVDFAIDPARTTGFVVALSTTAYDDIWTSSNVWMAFIIDPDTKLAEFDLANTQNTTDTSTSKTGLSAAIPSKVSLTVTPKHVKATLSNGQVLEGDYSWLTEGAKVYAYIFSHPIRAALPSSVAVKSVTVTR